MVAPACTTNIWIGVVQRQHPGRLLCVPGRPCPSRLGELCGYVAPHRQRMLHPCSQQPLCKPSAQGRCTCTPQCFLHAYAVLFKDSVQLAPADHVSAGARCTKSVRAGPASLHLLCYFIGSLCFALLCALCSELVCALSVVRICVRALVNSPRCAQQAIPHSRSLQRDLIRYV